MYTYVHTSKRFYIYIDYYNMKEKVLSNLTTETFNSFEGFEVNILQIFRQFFYSS